MSSEQQPPSAVEWVVELHSVLDVLTGLSYLPTLPTNKYSTPGAPSVVSSRYSPAAVLYLAAIVFSTSVAGLGGVRGWSASVDSPPLRASDAAKVSWESTLLWNSTWRLR